MKQETTTTGKQHAARTSRLRQHAGMHVIQALARCSNAQASILTGFTCQQAASSTQERKTTHNTAQNKQKGQQTGHTTTGPMPLDTRCTQTQTSKLTCTCIHTHVQNSPMGCSQACAHRCTWQSQTCSHCIMLPPPARCVHVCENCRVHCVRSALLIICKQGYLIATLLDLDHHWS